MKSLLPVIAVVLLIASWGTGRAESGSRESVEVPNASFEQVNPATQRPAGWGFTVSGKAQATCAADGEVAHTGKYSVRFHNESRLAPQVYSRFFTSVPVLPGARYKLSVWAKAKNVGEGLHFTDWQSYMLRIEAGSYDWRQFSTEFVTKRDQHTLVIGFNDVNLTQALWLDDVKLEVELTRLAVGGAELGFVPPERLKPEEGPLDLRVYLVKGDYEGKVVAALEAGGKRLAQAEAQLESKSAELKLSLPRDFAGREVELVVKAGGKEARVKMEVVSKARALAELKECEGPLAELKGLRKQARARGIPTDYADLAVAVGEDFLKFGQEDAEHGVYERACWVASDLQGIFKRAEEELRAELAGERAVRRVPRYVTSPIAIKNNLLYATVRYPDGKEAFEPVYFIGYGHFKTAREYIPRWKEFGVNFIQNELGPRSYEPAPGQVNPAALDEVEKLLRQGAAHDVAVCLLTSPHYFPDWAYKAGEHVKLEGNGFLHFAINHPVAYQVIGRYLRDLGKRLDSAAGLQSVCLSNEPIYPNSKEDPYTAPLWRRWLKERFADVRALNAACGTKYEKFDEVPVFAGRPVEAKALYYLWCRFNDERFAGWHKWMADQLHEGAPKVPVHAKIMNRAFERWTVGDGVNAEDFCAVSQLAGCDAWVSYTAGEGGRYAENWLGESMWYDLLRSMRGQPVANTEDHVIPDRTKTYVPGKYLYSVMWQGLVRSRNCSAIWVWERSFDQKSDFYGSIMHYAGCTEAVGRAALDAMRNNKQLAALQEAPARVALVYSLPSIIFSQDYLRSLKAAYEALDFCGEKLDFTTDRKLAREGAGKYKVLVLAGVRNCSEGALKAVEGFVARGGRLVVTGEENLKCDEYDRPWPEARVARLLAKAVRVKEGPVTKVELAEAMQGALRRCGLAVQAVEVKGEGGGVPFGVEWRTAIYEGKPVVSVTNLLNKAVRVKLLLPDGRAAEGVDLLSGRQVKGTLELEPLDCYFIQVANG